MWTVVMLLEGAGDAQVVLYQAHVTAPSPEEAAHQAFHSLASDDPEPMVVDVLVFSGYVEDHLRDSGVVRRELNSPW